jgi:hypothetical protein
MEAGPPMKRWRMTMGGLVGLLRRVQKARRVGRVGRAMEWNR